eukprot:scaffold185667_cov27-Tisochrysis_lutea.AAC.1
MRWRATSSSSSRLLGPGTLFRRAAVSAFLGTAPVAALCYTSGLPDDKFVARTESASNGDLLNQPSRWRAEKLVHIADDHPSTVVAATMLRDSLAEFPFLFCSDGSLSPPPPVKVSSNQGALTAKFALPPRANEVSVLLALLQEEDEEERGPAELEAALRHCAWITEDRSSSCTHLHAAGGQYILRRMKGIGASSLELECDSERMLPKAAAKFVAAYKVAHGAAATRSTAYSERTVGANLKGGSNHGPRKPMEKKAKKASEAGALLGYDADTYNQEEDPAEEVLRDLGCIVFMPHLLNAAPLTAGTENEATAWDAEARFLEQERHATASEMEDRWSPRRWGGLVGYNEQKLMVEESLLLPLLFPDAFDSVVSGTRDSYDANDIRPKAILLHGAPGTGKTSCARAIAARSRLPLVYLPLEAVASKWYGEGEQKLASAFDECSRLARDAAPKLPGVNIVDGEAGSGRRVLLFLDEIDALAGARDSKSMHEATRRTLSVLLRKIDGFEADDGVVVIGATNRQQDLDAALLSRFDVAIHFPLPTPPERAAIFGRYAKQLSDDSLERLAELSDGLSGRNILDVCKATERRWACKSIRNQTDGQALPPEKEYADSIASRQQFSAITRKAAEEEARVAGGVSADNDSDGR